MLYSDRIALARRIRSHKEQVANEVTAEFFKRHPDWRERYGDMCWQRGLEDAAFHAEFLASAIESGSEAQFADYARWTARVLSSRDIDATFLSENITQVRDALVLRLSSEDMREVSRIVDAGLQALSQPSTEMERSAMIPACSRGACICRPFSPVSAARR